MLTLLGAAFPLAIWTRIPSIKYSVDSSYPVHFQADTSLGFQPLEVSATRIGHRIGVSISVSRDLAKRPVFVRGHGRPEIEVLDGLAKAVHASLVKSPDGWSIRRTEANNRANRETSARYVGGLIRAEMGRIDADIARARSFGSITNQAMVILRQVSQAARDIRNHVPGARAVQIPPDEFSPAGRLLRRLVDRADFSTLTTIDVGETKTFSNLPNASEEPLHNYQADLAQYVRDQSDYLRGGPSPQFADDVHSVFADWLLLNPPPPPPEDLKVLLIENRRYDGITLTLEVFDKKGALVGASGVFTRHVVMGVRFRDTVKPLLDSPKSHWVALSSDSRDYVDRFANDQLQWLPEDTGPGARSSAASAALWPPSVLHPEQYEPDNYVIRELLEGLADRDRSTAFVAAPPDSIWEAAEASIRDGKACVEAFETLLGDAARSEIIHKERVIVLRGIDPIDSDHCVLDRKAVGECLRRMVGEGRVTLASWCAYRRWTPDADGDHLAFFFDQKLQASGLRSFHGPGVPRPVYKMLGELDSEGLLSTPHREPFRIEAPPLSSFLLETLSLREALTGLGNFTPLQTELAEFYPEGRVWGSLEITSDAEPAYWIKAGEKRVMLPFAMTPGMIAGQAFANPQLRVSREAFDKHVHTTFDYADLKFYPARKITYRIRLNLAHETHRDYDVTEDEEAGDPVSFRDVPASFWDAVYKAMMNATVSVPSSGPAMRQPPPPQ